jgi:hypothetical protein
MKKLCSRLIAATIGASFPVLANPGMAVQLSVNPISKCLVECTDTYMQCITACENSGTNENACESACENNVTQCETQCEGDYSPE